MLGYSVISVFDFFSSHIHKLDLHFLITQKKNNPTKKHKKVHHNSHHNLNLRRLKYILKIFSVFLGGAAFAVFFIGIPLAVVSWFGQLPNPDLLKVQGDNKSTRIVDRQGRLLYEIYVDRNYAPVKLAQIPKDLVNATISVEDADFYTHSGVKFSSIVRAFKKTLFENDMQGGSTITQQLIKNVLLTPERTYERKIKEFVLALLVERKYSKQQILEMYLNNIPYGGTAWGVQTASQKYFGKNVEDLNLAESTMLAGLPSSPSTYSPFTNLDAAKERQKYVLDRMVKLGYVNPDLATATYNQPLTFKDTSGYVRAPHFVDYVRRELEKEYGKRYVDQGGLTVTTTLDLDVQENAQDAVTKEVSNSQNLGITNGAAVVIDPKSGEILAYVGSVNYFKDTWGAYDVVSALRQPGSSIKPVTYSLALLSGYTPADYIEDSPITYRIGTEVYSPVNYDGKYHGQVTLRQALANSYNIPAVKLAAAVGPDNIVRLGNDLGLKNWQADKTYGLSVTLGGKEVTLLNLTNVYGTFARGGIYKDVTPFLSIKDSKGNEIYRRSLSETRVLSEEVAYIIWNILSDNAARLPAFGTRNFLTVPGHAVAVKTGTTDMKRDNWTLGFTPSYVVGVWVGNNDNKAMNPQLASGLSGAAPIWNKIMNNLIISKPDDIPSVPANLVLKQYDSCSKRVDYFITGSKIPSYACKKSDKS